MPLEQLPQPTGADRERGLTTQGEIEIYSLSGTNLNVAQKQGGLPSTWDLLVPGSYAEFGEHTDLLFYDRTNGTGTFLTTQLDGSLQLMKWHSNWRKSWSQIVPGTFLEGQGGGNNSLLFYDRAAGHGEFYKVDGKGGISQAAKHTNWRKTWTHILSGSFLKGTGLLGYDSLLFYDRAAGRGEFFASDGKGGISLAAQHTNWRKSWDIILRYTDFSNNNANVLVFYDRNAGHGEFYRVEENGSLTAMAKHTNWRKTWNIILVTMGPAGAFSGLLFYDRAAGNGEFFSVDGNGNISLAAKYTNWRKSWHSIAYGGFTGLGEPGLLFYQR